MDYASSLEALLDQGGYSEATRVFESFCRQYDNVEIAIARLYLDQGMYDPSMQLLSQIILEADPVSDSSGLAQLLPLLLPYINTIARNGEVQTAMQYLYELEQIGDQTDVLTKIEFYCIRLYCLSILGEFSRAKEEADMLLNDVVSINDDRVYSRYYMQRARIYDYQGSLLPAVEYYKMAMSHAKLAGLALDFLDPLHNLSNIYQYQGRYQLAVEGYKEELKRLEEMGFDFFSAVTRGDLAWSYFLQGKDDLSLDLLQGTLDFLHSYRSSENLLYHAEILARIIIVTSYSRRNDDVSQHIIELEEIEARTDSGRISLYLKVSKATVLMISNTFRNLSKAMDIFESIINHDKVIDIEFSLYAYLSSINILFQNYNYANQKSLLEELDSKVEQLYSFASTQESQSIRFQADWVRAKILLARGHRDEAIQLLKDILTQSSQLGFEHIANQVTSEISRIDEDLERSIDQTDFAYLRHDLTRQMLFSGQIQGVEEPILFFVMASSGMTLYSRHFRETLAINENLVSSFVKAIESFGSEAMNSTEALNQIQYRENKILIEHKEHVSIVFVIRGQTYPAQKKLLEFSKALELHRYNWIFVPNMSHIEESKIALLDELVDSILVY